MLYYGGNTGAQSFSVTEVMTPADVDLVCRYADMLQIGARNMQNYLLLEAVGDVDKPVLLNEFGRIAARPGTHRIQSHTAVTARDGASSTRSSTSGWKLAR